MRIWIFLTIREKIKTNLKEENIADNSREYIFG